MKCPIDQTDLHITERQGIEVDWCPTCRGVWLDRGELDKIIERTGTFADRDQPVEVRDRDERRRYYEDDDRDEGRRYEGERDPRRRKRRKSFLDDLFDFD